MRSFLFGVLYLLPFSVFSQSIELTSKSIPTTLITDNTNLLTTELAYAFGEDIVRVESKISRNYGSDRSSKPHPNGMSQMVKIERITKEGVIKQTLELEDGISFAGPQKIMAFPFGGKLALVYSTFYESTMRFYLLQINPSDLTVKKYELYDCKQEPSKFSITEGNLMYIRYTLSQDLSKLAMIVRCDNNILFNVVFNQDYSVLRKSQTSLLKEEIPHRVASYVFEVDNIGNLYVFPCRSGTYEFQRGFGRRYPVSFRIITVNNTDWVQKITTETDKDFLINPTLLLNTVPGNVIVYGNLIEKEKPKLTGVWMQSYEFEKNKLGSLKTFQYPAEYVSAIRKTEKRKDLKRGLLQAENWLFVSDKKEVVMITQVSEYFEAVATNPYGTGRVDVKTKMSGPHIITAFKVGEEKATFSRHTFLMSHNKDNESIPLLLSDKSNIFLIYVDDRKNFETSLTDDIPWGGMSQDYICCLKIDYSGKIVAKEKIADREEELNFDEAVYINASTVVVKQNELKRKDKTAKEFTFRIK